MLVFGPPNSGKTTACYLAAQCGLEFHADQVVFLDVRSDSLAAWGDPFPAVFRPETLTYVPELRTCCRPSKYGDCSFYYFDKSPMQAPRTEPVVPICSLFLDRSGRGETQLAEMNPGETVTRLQESMLFTDDTKLEFNASEPVNDRKRWTDQFVHLMEHTGNYTREEAIEAIDADGSLGNEKLLAQCQEFLRLFAIPSQDLVAVSYSDLLLRKREDKEAKG